MSKTITELPSYFLSVIVSFIVFYALLIPAAFLYPNYSPFKYTVSALGNTTINPNGWWLFSLCLIILAFTLLPFIYGAKKWYESDPSVRYYIYGVQLVGVFNSFALIMIAINPTDTMSDAHNLWSLVNFICIEIVILLMVIGLRNHSSYWNRLSILALVDFVCCIVYIYLLTNIREIATIFEWLTFTFILSYLLLVGYNMYKEGM